jgi:hypothetical protein
MIGFINSWLHTLLITIKLHTQYSAIADLHTLQFTVAHALGLSVFTIRLHTETITQITTVLMYEIFQSYFTSSQAELLYSPVLLVSLRLLRLTTDFNAAAFHSKTELLVKVKVKVTLRLTVSQSVSLGVEPHLGLMTRYLAITI